MSIELFLYLADIIPAIGVAAGIASTLLAICVFAAFAKGRMDHDMATIWDAGEKKYGQYTASANFADRAFKKMITPLVIAIILTAIIPTQKTIYLMGGAYIDKEAVASKIGQKVQAIIEKKLDALLDESKK